MASDVLVEARVSRDVKERAERVLERMGMSVSDALRILMTDMAENDQWPAYLNAPGEDPEYDAWFRAEVQKALDDPRPSISDKEANRRMARFRAELRAKSR